MADIEVIKGDCLAVLPTLVQRFGPIDAVVTDPPYGIGYVSGTNSRRSISTTGKRFSVPIEGDSVPFDPSPWLDFPAVAFTGAQHFYDRLPAGGSLHSWDKRGDYKPLDQADADFVWINRPLKSRTFRLAWRGICRHAENNRRIEHPTQKPVALMKWILGLLRLPPSALVLDPYAGVGTTGMACLEMGYRAILVEKAPQYIPTIHRRLRDAATPLLSAETS